MTQVVTEDSASQDLSWADELPPEVEESTQVSSDDTRLVNPPEHVCQTCGEELFRAPGARGRWPKYHPDCRPSAQGKATGTRGGRTVRVSKADQVIAEQVESALEMLRRNLYKGVALLSLVEPYDAFVVHVNSGELIENLRPVLMRFKWAREAALGVSTGGSVFGLVVTLATTVLPILAHHNLIPYKRAAQIMVQIPMFMMRLQQRLEEGSDGDMGQELLQRIAEEGKRQTEARMRKETAEATTHARAA